jgi:hypothetical protein
MRPVARCTLVNRSDWIGLAQIESGLPAAPNLQPPPSPEFHRLQESDLVRPDNRPVKQRTATCMLEAHEDLCRADERNEAQFKDVKQFLREEVERGKPLRKP